MTIKVNLGNQSARTLIVSGIEFRSGINQRTLHKLIRKIVQDDIAEQFAGQRTAKGALKKNTKVYELRKARLGLDSRRGHARGRLQRQLDSGVLWRVNWRAPTPDKTGAALIIFMEMELEDRLVYYRRYRWRKTPAQKGILLMTKKRGNQLRAALKELAA